MHSAMIGVLGRKGSGKNEITKVLVEEFGFYETSFAKKLYEEAAQAFGVTVEYLADRDGKESPRSELSLHRCKDNDFWKVASLVLREESQRRRPMSGWFISPVTNDYVLSPRKVLQLWGTEYRREQDNFYWIKALTADVQSQSNTLVAVSDVREAHEAAYIKRRDNGVVWKVERPNNPYVAMGSSQHSSETGVDSVSFDRVIVNDGTLEDLKENVRLYVKL